MCALFLAGCATTDKTTRVASIAKIIARRGSYEVVKYKPEYKPGFIAATVALDVVIALDQPTPNDLMTALAKIKVKEIQGDQGAMVIADIKDLLDLLAADNFKNLDVSGLKQIAQAIDDGLKQGLGIPPPVPPLP